MQLDFETLDVFTDVVFGGNPLAVVLGGDTLDGVVMQRIAREFNLSETVFVLPPADPAHTARLRIFTPEQELPFAGHPTIGTALLLAWRGAPGTTAEVMVLEEGAGLVPVDLERRDGQVVSGRLTAPQPPQIRETVAPELLARIVGLSLADLELSRGLPKAVSVGNPFTIVEVRSREALARVGADLVLWHEHAAPRVQNVYLLTRDAPAGFDFQVRLLAPLMGIPEDPATGSAAAAFAGWLGTHELGTDEPGDAAAATWMIAQGIEMGRPSQLRIEAGRDRDGVVTARVGGRAVRVMAGRLTITGGASGDL